MKFYIKVGKSISAVLYISPGALGEDFRTDIIKKSFFPHPSCFLHRKGSSFLGTTRNGTPEYNAITFWDCPSIHFLRVPIQVTLSQRQTQKAMKDRSGCNEKPISISSFLLHSLAASSAISFLKSLKEYLSHISPSFLVSLFFLEFFVKVGWDEN